eukprot:TRINITY_DN93753_c0_g1_i1.p1 TRINITY_DN93753_c0_g1~~TRINITY_DN93753_c0_g1_i1.p1  ORF type:complete len:165 (-),score=30.20 TRINITY_DN93753_c0_g1_i1:45-539(-)
MTPCRSMHLILAAALSVLIPAAFVVPSSVGSHNLELLPQKLPEVSLFARSITDRSTTATFFTSVIVGLLAGILSGPHLALAAQTQASDADQSSTSILQRVDATNYMDSAPGAEVKVSTRSSRQSNTQNIDKATRVRQIKEQLQKCKLCMKTEGYAAEFCKECLA